MDLRSKTIFSAIIQNIFRIMFVPVEKWGETGVHIRALEHASLKPRLIPRKVRAKQYESKT